MFIEQTPGIIRLFYPHVLWRKDKTKKVVYLTFDDGPNKETTPFILDTLDKYGIKATFFVIGNNAEKEGSLLSEIVSRGHQIGLHGYSHQRGLYKNAHVFFKDIEKGHQAVEKVVTTNILGEKPLFRPPHGAITPCQAKRLNKQYRVVLWDVITRDYDQRLSGEEVFSIVQKYGRAGSILVFHDSNKAQANMQYALEKTITYFLENGYTFGLL